MDYKIVSTTILDSTDVKKAEPSKVFETNGTSKDGKKLVFKRFSFIVDYSVDVTTLDGKTTKKIMKNEFYGDILFSEDGKYVENYESNKKRFLDALENPAQKLIFKILNKESEESLPETGETKKIVSYVWECPNTVESFKEVL